MKLIVLGATGGIGGQVVEQALAAGHEVTAVVRRPSAITLRHERLEVIRGVRRKRRIGLDYWGSHTRSHDPILGGNRQHYPSDAGR